MWVADVGITTCGPVDLGITTLCRFRANAQPRPNVDSPRAFSFYFWGEHSNNHRAAHCPGCRIAARRCVRQKIVFRVPIAPPGSYLATNVAVRVSWFQFPHQALPNFPQTDTSETNSTLHKHPQYGFDCDFGMEMRSADGQ